MALALAHQGYEYQDILVAARLVDFILGSVDEFHVDEKLVQKDIFDDLTTVDGKGHRERTQIKYTTTDDRALTLDTFIKHGRSLRLDQVISTILADRDGPGRSANQCSFRIIMRDAEPTDQRLLFFLRPADPDPGPFLPEMSSIRFRFHAASLWEGYAEHLSVAEDENNPFEFLKTGDASVNRVDLNWICEHLIIELSAPAASLDLTKPRGIEQLLLRRMRDEIGAGVYPNENRTALDVADSFIASARAARQGVLLHVSVPEILQRAQIRTDLGSVSRANPVDKTVEVRNCSGTPVRVA